MTKIATYNQKKKDLLRQWKLMERTQSSVALDKSTTNLFRGRKQGRVWRLNVKDFNQVISIDPIARTAEIEGMATYETIVAETLKHNLVPAVVPQLRSITLGGAVSG